MKMMSFLDAFSQDLRQTVFFEKRKIDSLIVENVTTASKARKDLAIKI